MSFGYLYIGRAENDKDGDFIFTKSGMTCNPIARLRGYQTNKGMQLFTYYKVYKVKAVEEVEKLFHDKITKHLTSMALFNKPSGGTEVRFTTPQKLDLLFLEMCKKYDVPFEDMTTKYKNLEYKAKIKKKGKKKINYLKNIRQKDYALYPFQKMIKRLHDLGISDSGELINDRAHLIVPTGGGKTVIFLSLLLSIYENSKLLIMVPSLSLVSQLYDKIREMYSRDLTVIINASKFKTVIDDNKLHVRLDKDSLDEEIQRCESCIVLSTYDSCDKLLGLEFDYAVFDECHRMVGKINDKNGNLKSKAKMLENKYINIGFRLFCTATARYANFKSSISMHHKNKFGPLLKHMTVQELVKLGKLTDYQLISLFSDKESSDIIKLVSSIKYAFNEFPINKMIVYAQNRTKANEYYESLKSEFTDFKIFYIDGLVEASKREKMLKYFRDIKYYNKKCIIVNVKVLNEGVDIPLADSICFADKKSSPIEIVQNIGRILRTVVKDGENIKKSSYVFLPAIEEDYAMISEVFKALAHNDQLSFTANEIMSSDTNKVDKIIGELIKKHKSVNIDDSGEGWNNLQNNTPAINEIIKSIVEEIRGSGIKTSTAGKINILLKLAKDACNDKNIFARKDFFKNVEQYGFDNLGYKGKTPQNSLSRDLTVNLRDVYHAVRSEKKGVYKLIREEI